MRPVADRTGLRLPPAVRQWWPLLAVGGLLALAGVAAAIATPGIKPAPLGEPIEQEPALIDGGSPSPTTLPDLSTPAPAEALPGWIGTTALLLCALLVLAIVVPLVYLLLRNVFSLRSGTLKVDGRDTAAPVDRPEEVLAAVDAGLAALSDADLDPRRAVIACWVRLEQVAASAGTPRQPGDTSTDLVLRLLGRHRVDRSVLARFAEVYREARYATHDIPEQMRTQAQSALRQLRGELLAGVEAP